MYRLSFLTLFLLLVPALSWAETPNRKIDGDICARIKEIIITLPHPKYIPAEYIWQESPGVFGADQFTTMLGEKDGILYFLGNSTVYDTFATPQKPQTYLAALKKDKGESAWEVRQSHKGALPAIMGLMHDKNIYSLHPTENDGWRMRVSEITKGDFVREFSVLPDIKNLTITDMAKVKDSSDIVFAGFITLKDRAEARLYRISPDGKKIWERKFLPGIASQLNKVITLPDGTMGLVGEIANGKAVAGWYLRVSKDGRMQSQTRFPRGVGAVLTGGKADASSLWLYGDILTGDEKRGVWLARTTWAGRVLWERFVTGETPYRAASLVTLPDTRGQLLINSYNERSVKNVRPHARLLTFSKEGFLQDEKIYRDSSGSQAADFTLMPDNTRLITGYTQTGFANLRAKRAELDGTYDAWALLLKPEGFYKDICPPLP